MKTTNQSQAANPWWAAFALDVTPLRALREYRLLYLGQFVSAFGSAISYVVLPVQMYQLTRSSLYVGLLGVAEFVPMLALAFVGGALADAVNRRWLVMASEAVMALCCGGLMLNALAPQPSVAVLFALAALFAACNALHRPAHEALTQTLVPAEQMTAVASLSTFRYSFNFIVGPALAGIIAARFGAATAFVLDGATYVIAFVTLGLMRPVAALPEAERASRQMVPMVKDALRYARARQELLGTYLIDINAMFFGMPMALFPALAESFGNASVGLLYSMFSFGALLATLTSGWTNRIHRHGLAITWAAAVWGLGIVGFGLARHLWLALFFLALAGAADTVSGIFRMTMWNQTIPEHMRGRMASIEMISYTTGPYLGNAEAGLAASLLGLRASVVAGGALCVLGCAVLAWRLPRFIRYDAHEAEKTADKGIIAKE